MVIVPVAIEKSGLAKYKEIGPGSEEQNHMIIL